jgi:hypothetical protein
MFTDSGIVSIGVPYHRQCHIGPNPVAGVIHAPMPTLTHA